MAFAEIPTLLSLDRYARIMGINPVHFSGATTPTVFPVAPNACQDIWTQYAWQDADRVSRDDLGQEIANAEAEIADYLGYWPAPKWIAQEVHPFPRFHRRDVYRLAGLDVRGQRVGLKARFGKVIAPGQRDLTPIATATVAAGSLAYSNTTGDELNETATVEVTTDETLTCEHKVYFAGHNGDEEWEIRPARTKAIASGTFTATFWSWQFIDPDLQTFFPTVAGLTAINIGGNSDANFVTSVEVYREFNDTTETSSRFFWEPTPPNLVSIFCTVCGGTGCVACALTTQDGCLHVRDAETGLVVPAPATYSATDDEWSTAAFSVCRDPDQVSLWYYAGLLDNRYLRGVDCQVLPDSLAKPIAWLATARLERPFCSCANVTALAIKMQEDLAFIGETSNVLSDRDLDNPFGTKRGEVMAWRRLGRTTPKIMRGAAI